MRCLMVTEPSGECNDFFLQGDMLSEKIAPAIYSADRRNIRWVKADFLMEKLLSARISPTSVPVSVPDHLVHKFQILQ